MTDPTQSFVQAWQMGPARAMAMICAMALGLAVPAKIAADPPLITQDDVQPAFDACLADPPKDGLALFKACDEAVYGVWKEKAEKEGFGFTAHDDMRLTWLESDEWERRIALKYAEVIAKYPGEDDYNRRIVKTLQAMQAAFPAWASTHCALHAALNGGGYQVLDSLSCHSHLSARHWVDLHDID